MNGMVTCNVCAAGFTVDGTLCIRKLYSLPSIPPAHSRVCVPQPSILVLLKPRPVILLASLALSWP